MRMKLTDRLAKTLEPGLYWDTDREAPKGLLLQVTKGGSRAYRLNYRRQSDGVERRVTIGDVASYTIAEARAKAAELRRMIGDGRDPLGERAAKRAAPTVAELVERFIAEALPNRAPTTQAEYKAMLDQRVVPALGKMKVGSVTREEVERLHRQITAEGKLRRANAVISLVSTLFAQAVTWKMCADLPTRGIKRNAELGRERYLVPEEIERLMGVLDHQRERRPDSVDTIMLAMLTGARRGELLGMTWDQIDLDAGVWTKPAATTKQRKMHRVPLSPEAVDLLRRRLAERERLDKVVSLRRDNHVFRGGGSVGHIGALERDWRVIRAVAGLEDVRLHDLRHSFASLLVGQGLSLPIIGAMLGHAKSATTQRYAHLSDAPLRAAAAIVGRLVRPAGGQ